MIFKVLSAVPTLLGLSGPRYRREAEKAFVTIANTARRPVFYEEYGVPDTVDGRFDLLALHLFSVFHRLRDGKKARAFSQSLFDTAFSNLDANLREMGVGDDRVGKRVRAFAEMFYGRVGVYEAGLAAEDDGVLIDAVGRNVFGDPHAWGAAPLARYLRESVREEGGELAALLEGDVTFPDPEKEIRS